MTDFNRVAAVTIDPGAAIDHAARQLGVPVHVGDVVRTFAEIETLLNH